LSQYVDLRCLGNDNFAFLSALLYGIWSNDQKLESHQYVEWQLHWNGKISLYILFIHHGGRDKAKDSTNSSVSLNQLFQFTGCYLRRMRSISAVGIASCRMSWLLCFSARFQSNATISK
jgi:hypothetical protein